MENKQRTKKKNYLDILIQNFDDSGHNYNELIQKGETLRTMFQTVIRGSRWQ